MNCNEWQQMSIVEKRIMTNKLMHLVSNSSQAFNVAEKLLKAAEELGLFDGCAFDIGTEIVEEGEAVVAHSGNKQKIEI